MAKGAAGHFLLNLPVFCKFCTIFQSIIIVYCKKRLYMLLFNLIGGFIKTKV